MPKNKQNKHNKHNTHNKHKGVLIFGAAILAAAWMIVAPDVLQRFDLSTTATELLIWVPAITVFFWSISGNKNFLACERRAFKKLFNLP